MQLFLAQVRELSDKEDQQIVVWCGLEGMACSDAAVQLGLSTDAVIKRWQRLRQRLRERPWAQALLAPDS